MCRKKNTFLWTNRIELAILLQLNRLKISNRESPAECLCLSLYLRLCAAWFTGCMCACLSVCLCIVHSVTQCRRHVRLSVCPPAICRLCRTVVTHPLERLDLPLCVCVCVCVLPPLCVSATRCSMTTCAESRLLRLIRDLI